MNITETYLEKKKIEIAELENKAIEFEQMANTKKRILREIYDAELKKLQKEGWSVSEPKARNRVYYHVDVIVTDVYDRGTQVDIYFFVKSGELTGMSLKHVVTKSNMYALKSRFEIDDEIKLYSVRVGIPIFDMKKSITGQFVYKVKAMKTKRVNVRKPGGWK